MRKVTLLIALFYFTDVNSQIIRANAYYRPFAGVSNLLLDDYPGAAVAYSLRKIDKDYSGSAIRVRRSSDNTESDIGFISGGTELDTASLKSFVGTGGSDDGFVVSWYDQSGNSRTVTNSTSTAQPLIMDNGVILRVGGKPAIFSDGSDDVLKVSWTVNSNLVYCFSVAQRESGGRTDGRFLSFGPINNHDWNSTNNWAALTVGTSTAYTYRNSAEIANVSTSLGTRYLFYYYINGSGGGIAINANSPATGSTSSTAMNSTTFAIMSSSWTGTLGEFKGYTQEVVVYRSDESSNRTGISSNINTFYSIY